MASCACSTEQPGTQQLTRPAGPAACRLELDRHELLRRSHDCLGLATMDAPAHDDPFTLEPPPGYRDRGHHDKEVRTPLRPCNTLNRGLGQHILSWLRLALRQGHHLWRVLRAEPHLLD